MSYKEIVKDTEKVILKVLDRGPSEVLGAIGNGKKHHHELETNHQRLNSAQKVEYWLRMNAAIPILMICVIWGTRTFSIITMEYWCELWSYQLVTWYAWYESVSAYIFCELQFHRENCCCIWDFLHYLSKLIVSALEMQTLCY